MLRRIIASRLHGDALVLGVLLLTSLLQDALSASLNVGGLTELYHQPILSPAMSRLKSPNYSRWRWR